jgi:hypothetical protein
MGEEGKGFPLCSILLERLIMAINGHARAEYASTPLITWQKERLLNYNR